MQKVYKILLALAAMTCLSLLANAQNCQNQGCRRPTADTPCYGCSDLAGFACSVFGTCPQSCYEQICPPPADGGGGGGGGGDLNQVRFTPSPFELKHQLIPRALIATVQPQPVACQPLVLSKKLLFSL
jgi:hypothetical protein